MKSMLNAGRRWALISAVCALMVLLSVIGTSADEVTDVNVKIERVALFKNGLGYFTSAATLPKGADVIRISKLPVPSHGTFWVGYPKDAEVRTIITSMEDVVKPAPARSIAMLLQANPGRKVSITTSSPEMPEITGTIVNVNDEERPTGSPSAYLMDMRLLSSRNPYQPNTSASLVIIKTNSGYVALNVGSIVRADFEDDDITTSIPDISQQPIIRMELDKPSNEATVGVSYLARGITWSPSYLIDISDSATARFSAKAVVINEVADLQEIHLDLVTGFPNIQFADVNSPVAMSQNLEGFLRALTSGRSESGGRRDMMRQQAMLSNIATYEDEVSAPLPGYSTAQKGTVSEDLFLYPVERFTLKRGETACIPLFTAEIPYRHLYIWKIPDMLNPSGHYRQDRDSDEQKLAEEVWHSCRLVNNMEMPWTTAAVEFVTNGQFTGQDVCYYTAPGAETTIRINRAMNVVAEEIELELERERNVSKFNGYAYDLVKVSGELKLHNRQNKSVTVEVTKNLSGELLETAPQARDIPTAKGLKRVNPSHVLVWEVELKPGQELKLTYSYQVYVRG